MAKKSKKFRIKARGSYIGSEDYAYLRRNGEVLTFFRRVDADSHIRKIRKHVREKNRMLPADKRETFNARIVKV